MNPSERDLRECLRLAGVDPAVVTGVRKIPGEASTRSFFRLRVKDAARVAMVYPQPAEEEIERIVRLTGVYLRHGVRVPQIEAMLGPRGLLLEDAGTDSFQTLFRWADRPGKRRLLDGAAELLDRLRRIELANTGTALDRTRVEYEMGFFSAHFAAPVIGEEAARELRQELLEFLAPLPAPVLFAHRDFHSRNLVVCGDRLTLVDFQDSLRAPPLYDLVSLAFDSYLDLGAKRPWLLDRLRAHGWDIDPELLALTALERNVKALGTFGFQVRVRGHRAYARYVPRTLRHVRGHLAVLRPGDPIEGFFTRDWEI